MSEADFAPYIREKAEQITAVLEKLSPYERSLVIHEMECMLEDRAAAEKGLPLQDEAEAMEDIADAAALWLGLMFKDLSSDARWQLMETAQQLWDSEKFERLVGDSDGGEDDKDDDKAM